jgi:hypothetical protein
VADRTVGHTIGGCHDSFDDAPHARIVDVL